MKEINKTDILRQQPFRLLIKIVGIESLFGEGAFSGEAFKVISFDKKQYKLRYCAKLRKAKSIEKNVGRLPHAFPRFYGREGRYLLFHWVEGEMLTQKATSSQCYHLGKLVGEAHALNDSHKKEKADKCFNNRVKKIEAMKSLDENTVQRAREKYLDLKKSLEVDVALEFFDLHPGNAIVDKKGRIYFIDEEGFDQRIKGLGLAMPIFKWMDKEQQDSFWKGYQEHHNNDYFDKEYQKLIQLIALVGSIAAKHERGKDFSCEKEELAKML